MKHLNALIQYDMPYDNRSLTLVTNVLLSYNVLITRSF